MYGTGRQSGERVAIDPEQIGELRAVLGAELWAEVLAEFRKGGREALDAMAAARRGDLSPVKPAHALRGMALNMGAYPLAALAERIERPAAGMAGPEGEVLEAAFAEALEALERVEIP
jgi:hypothetical protein